MISLSDLLLRLLVALLFCGAVGLQRAITGKAAGIRTHILVGLGAALFTLVSEYAFAGQGVVADRIAAQVVSGVGFIGGGAILKERGSIKGLTTAAGLWASAAVGMAAGAGLFAIGGVGVLLILLTLVALRWIEIRLPRRMLRVWTVHIECNNDLPEESLRHLLAPYCHHIGLNALERAQQSRITYAVELPHQANVTLISDKLRDAGALTVAWTILGDVSVEEGL